MKRLIALSLVTFLSACTEVDTVAPVENRGLVAAINSDQYRVQKGDTLYSIAWASNLDYRQLAAINHLKAPFALQAGKILRVKLPSSQLAHLEKPLPYSKTVKVGAKNNLLVLESPRQLVLPTPKDEKKSHLKSTLNEPYVNHQSKERSQLPMPDPARLSALPTNEIISQKQTKIYDSNHAINEKNEQEERKDLIFAKKCVHCFLWPTQGKIVGQYSSSQLGNKGIDIAGQYGQPVKASQSGVVVYSGSGLRGYGNLIIIKHNVSLLSAYAHNSELIVTEGMQVKAGQEIAFMGRAPSGQEMLHFEIRRDGKPVNPTQYLK